jgi:hypothetical protein
MKELHPARVVSEAVDGPVSGDDWVYASLMLEDVSRDSPCEVRQARLRLFAERDATSGEVAIAEAVMMLHSGSVICAGSVASTMPDAIDDLRQRLRRRLSLAATRASRRHLGAPELRPKRWMVAGRA